jgi:hypothetical protein
VELNPVFYDKSLMLQQYGFGVAANLVAGALGFFIGSGIESAIYDDRAAQGTLKWSGVRYDHLHGAFYGSSAGVLLGSAMTVYFVGETDEEHGSFWATLAAGAVTTWAAYAVADLMGVQEKVSFAHFAPLLVIPSSGALAGFHLSRYWMDQKRHQEVEMKTTSNWHWEAPRLSLGLNDGEPSTRLDLLSLRFR